MGEREQAYIGGNLEIERGLVLKWKEEISMWGKRAVEFLWEGIRYLLHMPKGFLLAISGEWGVLGSYLFQIPPHHNLPLGMAYTTTH